MLKRVLASAVAVASIACNRGCTVPASSPHPHDAQHDATPSAITTIATASPSTEATDDSGVTIITFDDVTEKVWDVDADIETTIGTDVRKRFARRLCRSAFRTCLAPYLSAVAYQVPRSYRLSLDLQLGPKEQFKMLLNWTQGNQPLPRPIADFQTKIYDCYETEFRNSGIYMELRGYTVIFHYIHNIDFSGDFQGEE